MSQAARKPRVPPTTTPASPALSASSAEFLLEVLNSLTLSPGHPQFAVIAEQITIAQAELAAIAAAQ